VGQPRHDDALEIAEDGLEALRGRGGVEGSAALISPGATRDMTGRPATRSR